MFSFDEKSGSVSELTAGGARQFSRPETAELFELIDIARRTGGGSTVVAGWLAASAKPRALEDTLAPELRARGFDHTCPMCLAGAPARRFSVARARRAYGVNVSRSGLRAHKLHARMRKGRSLPPGTVRHHGGLPARGARLDGDPRAEEPDYPGVPTAKKKRKVVPPEPAEPPWQD